MSEELRDIKPLLTIPDYSYFIYLGVIFLVVFLLFGILFFLIKAFWLQRKVDIKKRYFQELEGVDWIDSKASAYAVTLLAYHFVEDEKVKEIYEQTLPFLEPYKYRKEVPCVDEETLRQCSFLVHVIDESF